MRFAFLVILACSVLTGCHGEAGGTASVRAPSIPALPLVSLVDPASPGVFRLDLARLERADLFDVVSDMAELATEGMDGDGATTLRTVLRSRELIMFLARTSSGGAVPVMIVRGRFDGDAIRAGFTASGALEEPVPGIAVLPTGEDGAVALVEDHTLVLGRREVVDAVLSRQRSGGGGQLPSNSEFRRIADAVDFANSPIAFAVVPRDDMRASGAGDEALELISQAQALGFGFDIVNGLRGRAVVELSNTLTAIGLTTLLRSRLRDAADDPELVAVGFARIAPHLDVERDGSNLVLSIDAPSAAVRDALGMLRSRLDANRR